MNLEAKKSTITPEDQARIDNAVKLGALKQVQLVKFLYEKLGHDGLEEFSKTVVKPWATAWAERLLKEKGLKKGDVDARTALYMYEAVHDHTKICSDHLDMFFSVDHADFQIVGAKYCPVAYQWMQIWPEGAHFLCYLYSHAFDEYFFAALNPNLVFTKHAECCADQPGIPHGRPCVMQIETKGKPVNKKDLKIIEDPGSIEVAPIISDFLAGKKIDYLPHIPEK